MEIVIIVVMNDRHTVTTSDLLNEHLTFTECRLRIYRIYVSFLNFGGGRNPNPLPLTGAFLHYRLNHYEGIK